MFMRIGTAMYIDGPIRAGNRIRRMVGRVTANGPRPNLRKHDRIRQRASLHSGRIVSLHQGQVPITAVTQEISNWTAVTATDNRETSGLIATTDRVVAEAAVAEGGGVSQAVGLGAGVASATFVMLWSVTHNEVSASFTFKA